MDDEIREYTGRDIRVRYQAGRCIHAAECVTGLPQVFDRTRRPWVLPDAGQAGDIVEVVLRCPTGALHFQRLDGGAEEPAPDVARVQVGAAGPLYARGDLTLQAEDGTVVLRDTRVALCRCGASRHKPFCDNSHLAAGFDDPGVLGENRVRTDPAAGPEQGVVVLLAANGPLRLSGPVELAGADGQAVLAGNRVSLCRCGGSHNKPFCDGTHRQNGFQSE